MSSIIGNVKILEVESVILYGDSNQLSPQNVSKLCAGAGSFITGDFVHTNNAVTATDTNDPDKSDKAINDTGNAGVISFE